MQIKCSFVFFRSFVCLNCKSAVCLHSDLILGTESGIRLYLKEIVALLSSALESQQWKMKAQAATAMGTIGSKMKSGIPAKEQGTLLIQLVEALSGRTWSGKEAILVSIKGKR